MKILLVTPPMTQLNTPYPATAYLTGFLRSRGIDAVQEDPAIDLVLAMLSRKGLQEIAEVLQQTFPEAQRAKAPSSVQHFLAAADDYIAAVEAAVCFLQGKDTTLAHRLAYGGLLPQGPRFSVLDQLEQVDGINWAFGSLGTQDRAKFMASLFIDDLADVIRDGIDPRFELSRYGETLAASAPSFDPLSAALQAEPSLVDRYLATITLAMMERHRPQVVGFTAPFPGNVYAAFRMARLIKQHYPHVKTVLGGGYVNTELRRLRDVRVFEAMDYICCDDGERPLLSLIEHWRGERSEDELLRTYVLRDGAVHFINAANIHDIPQKDTGTPTYDGLDLGKYLSLAEMLNPMHRIWSDGRWNKLTLAHGCYWRQCHFCDVSLDYIGRYEENTADRIIDRMEVLIAETGQRGFHFVDEAAPPKVLFAMAKRLIERRVVVSWWGNIRFEKAFTAPMAALLAQSGCIAMSGGLEVASDRLLKLMNKGVTVEQVARVTHNLTEAGILVHAYLMYGFPTQSVQETVDALERVRQLFSENCIQSAYWHRFSVTVHSPIGRDPERFGIRLLPRAEVSFAENDLDFVDPSGVDHDMLGQGLRKAIYNYMHGLELERPVRQWFDKPVPHAKVPRDLIKQALSGHGQRQASRN